MAISSSLPSYIEPNKDSLILKTVLASKTAKYLTLQTGVKTKTQLNLLSTAAPLQSGASCGWNASGTSTLTARTITAPVLKVNLAFCDKTLLTSALQYDVRLAAGQATLPFEQQFVEDVIKQVELQSEALIWKGDTAGATSTYLDLADGLIKIVKGESCVESGSSNKGKNLSSTNIKAEVDAIVAAIPVEILATAKIYMGQDAARLYQMALQAANLYAGAPNVGSDDFMYPFSQITIVPVAGLNGTNQIFAFDSANVFYGTDLESDKEAFDFWYSQDNREFRLEIAFAQGVQVAFPDQVVMRNKANTFVA